CLLSFFFNDTATTEIYTLSLHDALPIYQLPRADRRDRAVYGCLRRSNHGWGGRRRGPGLDRQGLHRRLGGGGDLSPHLPDEAMRSEEHTSELQSRGHLVCRLLLEKKKF